MQHVSSASDLRASAAISGHVDPLMAAEHVVEQTLGPSGPFTGPGPSTPAAVDLAMAFISGDHAANADEIGRYIRQHLDPGCLIGVTAAGVAGLDQEIEGDEGVSLLSLSLPGTTLRPFSYAELPHATPDDPEAMRDLAEAVGATPELRAIIFFADPYSVPVGPVVEALSALPDAVPGLDAAPIIGGMASTPGGPGRNALLYDGSTVRSGGVGVTISGDITVDTLVSQGCRPIGEPLIVTSAKRNVLMQLGGKRAIDVVRELVNGLSEDERMLLSSGLFIGRVVNEYKQRFGRGDFLIRSVLGVDQKAGAVAVGDALRVGQTVQFHLRDADTAREDLELLLQSEQFKAPAAASMLCTCSSRGLSLFDEPNFDASAVTRWLGKPAGIPPASFPLAGFFAGGEIGPIGRRSYVHGHTASLAIFRPGG